MVIHAAAESTADAHPPASLGADIRALRRARGVTLEALGSQIGRSVGWLSQVERDLSTPAMDDIEAIASALGVSRSFLFGAGAPRPGEEGRIVRAGAGRSLGSSDGEAGRGTVGLVERLLSPDLSDEFEVIHSVFRPGSRRKTRVARPTTELACIIAGKLDVWLGPEQFTLEAGDSIRIRGESLRWANPYETDAVAIWVIAPPVY